MRITEVDSLTVGDVDVADPRFLLSARNVKTARSRWVPVEPWLVELVIESIPLSERTRDRHLFVNSCASARQVAVKKACMEAGVPPFAQKSTEQQLRHLGRGRVNQLYDWLVETDLGLKGSSQLPPRTLLERLVVRLAQKV